MSVTRRQFLKRSAVTAVALGIAPSALERIALGAARGDGTDKVVVFLNLRGGNDGLNTIVPLDQYDRYRALRPTLALSPSRTVELPDAPELGLNRAMGALGDLYARGRVAAILGAGSPPDTDGLFDHARSSFVWQTADPTLARMTGWLGRYLDTTVEGEVTPAIDFGGGRLVLAGDPALVASGRRSQVFSIQSTDDIGVTLAADVDALHTAYIEMARQRSSVGAAAEYNRSLREQLIDQSSTIRDGGAGYVPAVAYPNEVENPVAYAFLQCARLVAADIGVRALSVGLLGFDTHTDQNDGAGGGALGYHDALLAWISDAIGLFQADLEAHGLADRVVTVVTSEFGRRPQENSDRGTDHGYASVAFVVGSTVRGGVYGDYPSLAADRLVIKENLAVTTDFRSIYATVLARFLDTDPVPIIGATVPTLGFL